MGSGQLKMSESSQDKANVDSKKITQKFKIQITFKDDKSCQ